MPDEKRIYGRIDCPVCQTDDGVRITKDKNSEPFGFCDAKCEVQLRIGGKLARVKAFYAAHPEIYAAMHENAVTVTEEKPVIVTDKKLEEPAKKTGGFSLESL